ncbi:hypothetical protein Q7C18_16475 [Nesterenkonia sp. CL21]|uniref:hypothetical protein n=1 Tax=Nesterenkonia sp. CL21 TaxID=3064894 RepID=UPI002878B2F6|nr:hypothetical protein [Nesterenkonia sp. CL21]MDS2174298.1 hypothetical protein [Nesterenkonia sp. CL21]
MTLVTYRCWLMVLTLSYFDHTGLKATRGAEAEPSERRMLNRGLFDRITIDDGDEAAVQPTEAIRTTPAAGPGPHDERTPPRDHAGRVIGQNVCTARPGIVDLTPM